MANNHGTSGTRCTRFGDGLTPKEIRFCEEYVKDFNGAGAVRRAGLCPNNPQYAAQYATKYLDKEDVRDYINELMTVMSEKCMVEVDDLLRFWVSVMNNPNEATPNRLKSSDYIAKVIGAYDVKRDTDQGPIIVMDLAPPTDTPVALEPPREIIMEDDEDETDSE